MSATPPDALCFRLVVAYDGTDYAGWQRQANTDATVQQQLEEALEQVFGAGVVVAAAGRTDAGVHALGQRAHLHLARETVLRSSATSDTEEAVAEACRALVRGTNAHLAPAIRVLAAEPAPEGFHARFSAVAKTYRYRWLRGRVATPQEARYVASVPDDMDVAAMRRAAAALVGTHDFGAFARSGGAHTGTVRTVLAVDLVEDGAQLDLLVRGEGFLRGMVRAMAGTLREVGQGKRSGGSVAQLVGGAVRAQAGPSAPAQGLTLLEVEYE